VLSQEGGGRGWGDAAGKALKDNGAAFLKTLAATHDKSLFSTSSTRRALKGKLSSVGPGHKNKRRAAFGFLLADCSREGEVLAVLRERHPHSLLKAFRNDPDFAVR